MMPKRTIFDDRVDCTENPLPKIQCLDGEQRRWRYVEEDYELDTDEEKVLEVNDPFIEAHVEAEEVFDRDSREGRRRLCADAAERRLLELFGSLGLGS